MSHGVVKHHSLFISLLDVEQMMGVAHFQPAWRTWWEMFGTWATGLVSLHLPGEHLPPQIWAWFQDAEVGGALSGGGVYWVHVMTRLYSYRCCVNQIGAQKSQSNSVICCNNWACPRVTRQTDTQQFFTVHKAGVISSYSNSNARMAACQTATRQNQQWHRVTGVRTLNTGFIQGQGWTAGVWAGELMRWVWLSEWSSSRMSGKLLD